MIQTGYTFMVAPDPPDWYEAFTRVLASYPHETDVILKPVDPSNPPTFDEVYGTVSRPPSRDEAHELDFYQFTEWVRRNRDKIEKLR
jgi:hypothetical protein